jgi:hypothetical protein
MEKNKDCSCNGCSKKLDLKEGIYSTVSEAPKILCFDCVKKIKKSKPFKKITEQEAFNMFLVTSKKMNDLVANMMNSEGYKQCH